MKSSVKNLIIICLCVCVLVCGLAPRYNVHAIVGVDDLTLSCLGILAVACGFIVDDVPDLISTGRLIAEFIGDRLSQFNDVFLAFALNGSLVLDTALIGLLNDWSVAYNLNQPNNDPSAIIWFPQKNKQDEEKQKSDTIIVPKSYSTVDHNADGDGIVVDTGRLPGISDVWSPYSYFTDVVYEFYVNGHLIKVVCGCQPKNLNYYGGHLTFTASNQNGSPVPANPVFDFNVKTFVDDDLINNINNSICTTVNAWLYTNDQFLNYDKKIGTPLPVSIDEPVGVYVPSNYDDLVDGVALFTASMQALNDIPLMSLDLPVVPDRDRIPVVTLPYQNTYEYNPYAPSIERVKEGTVVTFPQGLYDPDNQDIVFINGFYVQRSEIIRSTGSMVHNGNHSSLDIPILGDILDWIINIFNKLVELFANLPLAIQTIIEKLTSIAGSVAGLVEGAIDGVIEPIEPYITGVFDLVSGYALYNGIFNHFLPEPVAIFLWVAWETSILVLIVRMIINRN